jgi:hypothetical protein
MIKNTRKALIETLIQIDDPSVVVIEGCIKETFRMGANLGNEFRGSLFRGISKNK